MLPSVLASVPEILALKLSSDELWQWHLCVQNWINSKNDQEWEFVEQIAEHTSEWLRKRRIRSTHLLAGPNIWIWNDGRHIQIGWDNRGLEINGIPAWTAEWGSWSLPVEEFIGEVRKFDRNLIEAMQSK